jgi:hypothetical protein
MTFLYPSFLWALAALSIPVLIHLFNFRRTTRVFFSNTRFLKLVKEVTTAKRRLKHYLILASRLLFLLFLVLAFAQPLIPASEQLGNSRSIVLYIDNSQSMSAQMGDKTRGIDAGLSFGQNIVDLFPPDTRYKILTNDFAPFSNSFKTKTEARDLLAQIRVSPVSRSMEEIKQRLEQDGSNRSREFFWISDFQKSTTGKIPSQWDSTARWHLVPITLAPLPNVFLDSAYLENPFAAGGEKNVLTVKVRNEGSSEVDQLNLKLTINNIQAGTALVDIPQHGITETTFDLTTGLTGLNRALISFNDFPVSFDNEFYLALNFTDKINILEIKTDNAVTPIEKVFGNKQVFSFKSFSVSNFNYSLLAQADLVIVNGLNKLDGSLSLSLRNYLDDSGTLMLIPGTSPEAPSFQQFAGTNSIKVFPEKKDPADLDRPDFNNPFFENVFEERSVSIAMPKASRVLEWGADRSAILRFKNDQPFLSKFTEPRGGALYLLASPLKAGFTDFYNHALFVPVMYRIAGSSRKNESRLYHTLNEDFIALRVDSLSTDESLRLVGVQEIVPAQRRVSDLVYLDIPKFSISQGFYNVVSARDTVSLVAFNLDKAESLLDQYNGEAIKTQMGNGKNISIFEATSTEAFSNEIKARYLGKPLWKYAIMLALFFLLAEVLLIRFLK